MVVRVLCGLLLLHYLVLVVPSSAFVSPLLSINRVRFAQRSSRQGQSDVLAASLYADEGELRALGENLIRKAAIEAGASRDHISVEWKASRIIVTISEKAKLSTEYEDGEVDLLVDLLSAEDELELDDDDDEDFLEADAESVDEGNVEAGMDELSSDGPDISAIARNINRALKEGGEVGDYIATNHEIEVTTPGVSDFLSEDVINAYRGFDVIVETLDKKTGKKQIVEGKLIEKSKDATKLNVMGRVRKLSNGDIESIRLPKAKKEKGAR